MLEKYFRDSSVIARLRGTVLGRSVEDLVARLDGRGHAPTTVRGYARGVGHFACWLAAEKISVGAVTEATLDRFVAHLPRCRCPVPFGSPLSDLRASLRHLLIVLRETRRTRPPSMPPATFIDRQVQLFVAHLQYTRGATAQTRSEYARYVREFLGQLAARDTESLRDISARDVIEFVAGRATRCKPGTAKLVATALRSFFRFLQMKGVCDTRLADAVPIIPRWKLARVPRLLTDEHLAALLRSFNRATAIGRRDYAMTLCLSQMGLRAAEVAGLSLDDVDWRRGTVRIAVGKSRRDSVLPLPAPVGRAIVAYLRRGRPPTTERRIFVQHVVPVGVSLDSAAVRSAIRRAFGRARIDAPSKGTHVLRHSAATRMLRAGASLKDLADVLRHRCLDTTLIYTKVDLPRLKAVALPWPGVRA